MKQCVPGVLLEDPVGICTPAQQQFDYLDEDLLVLKCSVLLNESEYTDHEGSLVKTIRFVYLSTVI